MAKHTHEELLVRIDEYASFDVAQLQGTGLTDTEILEFAAGVRKSRLEDVRSAIGEAMVEAVARSQREADAALQMVDIGNRVLAEYFGADDRQAREFIEGLDVSHVSFADFTSLATSTFRPDTATRLWNCLSRAYNPTSLRDVGLFHGDTSHVHRRSGEEWKNSGVCMDLEILGKIIARDDLSAITNFGQQQMDLAIDVLGAVGILKED